MLGIIAGGGQLPVYLAAEQAAKGSAPVICEFHEFPSDVPSDYQKIHFRIERLGEFFDALRAAGVTDLVTAGGIRRPSFDPSALDAFTMKIAAQYVGATEGGDDQLSRMILGVILSEGFKVHAAQDLAPELLPDAGVLTDRTPDQRDEHDAGRAAEVLAAIGDADVGQGCVVASRQVLAVEALPGTDFMLRSLTEDGVRLPDLPRGGVLMKAPKASQERRIDLPAIGPGTVGAASDLGLNGIVVEAGGVMVIDPKATIATANDAGLFLWVRERG